MRQSEFAVREAAEADVEACVAMLQADRVRLANFEPRFWNPGPHAEPLTRVFLGHLLAEAGTLWLVAEAGGEVIGFLIARPQPAPPVFDPGGPTALIDDFCVADSDRWEDLGPALLSAARDGLRARGFAQIVVVRAHKDPNKRDLLQRAGLSLASEWWTAAT